MWDGTSGTNKSGKFNTMLPVIEAEARCYWSKGRNIKVKLGIQRLTYELSLKEWRNILPQIKIEQEFRDENSRQTCKAEPTDIVS